MRQSGSYLSFKKRIQEIFDFAVLVTASVPVTKLNLKLYKDGKINRLPDPDFFEPSVIYEITEHTLNSLGDLGMDVSVVAALQSLKGKPLNTREFKERIVTTIGEEQYKKHRNHLRKQSHSYVDNLRNTANGYQSKLATYLYFSAFSYFEAYVIDLSREVGSFFTPLNQQNYLDNHQISEGNIGLRIKLDKKAEGGKINRYEKLSHQLDSFGYKTPEEIIFASAIRLFKEKIDNLQANDIPVFLQKVLLFNMSQDDIQSFHNIRANRNRIGHGEIGYTPSLKDVTEANKFFKRISSQIDKHTMFHFAKPRNYRSVPSQN